MPKHSKHRRGCDCLNKTLPLTAISPELGCSYCAEPYRRTPCAYKALFECNYWTTLGEKIAEPCIVLRKDCPSGCSYTSRWDEFGVEGDLPVIRASSCTVPPDFADTGFCSICPAVQSWTASFSGVGSSYCDGPYGIILPGKAVAPGLLTFIDNICLEYDLKRSLDLGVCVYSAGNSLESVIDSPNSVNQEEWVRFEFRVSYNGSSYVGEFYVIYICWSYTDRVRLCEISVSTETDAVVISPSSPFDCTKDVIFCKGDYTPVAPTATGYIHGAFAPNNSSCYTQFIPTELIEGWQKGCTWISQTFGEGAYDYTRKIKWTLVVTSATTATLVLTTRSGHSAHYECSNFRCYGRSTFQMTSQDPETIGIPKCLCIAALNPPVEPGECSASFCDDGQPTRSWVHNDGYVCSVLAIPAGDYVYPRGPDLPAEVGDGDSLGRCNYFWRTFSYTSDVDCTQWSPGFSGLVGVLILAGDGDKVGCTGVPSDPNTPDRSVEYQFWCYDFDLDLWVFQGSQCGLYYCCDPSISPIEFSASCCCPAPVTTCGDCNPPETLYADDGTTTVTLTWNGSEWYGQAPVDVTFCGYTPPSGERVPVILYCVVNSDYNLSINADDCGTATATCDPFEVTFTTCCTLTVTE